MEIAFKKGRSSITIRKMRRTNLLQHTLLFIILGTLIICANFFSKRATQPALVINKQKSALNYKSNLIRSFSIGNTRLLASLLWVQTLIESDIDHYKTRDLNSWMYLRFDTITDLDPHFYEAYLYGGQYLSVIKDDILGAQKIYEKGLKLFPDDYELNFYAAFNYYFELNDIEHALICYQQILGHPNMPAYLHSLIAKLQLQGKNPELALELIKNAYHNAKADSPIKKHFFRTYYKVQAQLDMKCLNSPKAESCNTRDLLGNPYPQNKKGAFIMPLLDKNI